MTGRRRDLLSVLADTVTVATAVALLAGSLGLAVGSLSRTGTLLILVVLAAVFGVLVWIRRSAWWKAIRPRYVSAIVWLARPVRSDVVGRLRSEGATHEQLMSRVGRLTGLSAEMLEMLLRACAPRGGGWVVVRAVDRQLLDRESASVKPYFDDVTHACDELYDDGFLSQVDEGEADVWVRVRFSTTVRDRFALRLRARVHKRVHGDGMVRVGEPEPLVWGLVAESSDSFQEQRVQ